MFCNRLAVFSAARRCGIVKAVLYQLVRDVIRNPVELVFMLGLTIIFALIAGGTSGSNAQVVHVFSTELSKPELQDLATDWEENNWNVRIVSEEEAMQLLSKQQADGVIEAGELDYTLHAAYEGSTFVPLTQAELNHYYANKRLAKAGVTDIVDEGSFAIKTEPMQEGTNFDRSLQALFGFALYFAIFTMSFSIMSLLRQKEEGIWNRLILAPASKTALYAGNLLFSFLLAYVQIFLSLVLFNVVFGYDYYGGFWKLSLVLIPYVFAIMAIGLLLSGIVRSSQQLNAVIPLVATVFAMIGGAFWPLEIVRSETMRALSYLSPIRHALDMMKGATYQGASLAEFLLPTSVLLFIGLTVTGIGIRLMERKAL